jgi:hypothetical protein
MRQSDGLGTVLSYVDWIGRAGRPVATGEVALWGSVIDEGDTYRAEFGYPRRLLLPANAPESTPPTEQLAAVADRYGIEIAPSQVHEVPS